MVQSYSSKDQQRLLLALSEELKSPLISITYTAEMGALHPTSQAFSELQDLSQNMLKLVDAYMLSLRVASGQQALNLEPISAGAILMDSAHELSHIADLGGCELIIDVTASQKPLMADRVGLSTAITSLGRLFINSELQETKAKREVRLSAYKVAGGVAIGVFDSLKRTGFTTKSLQTSRLIFGSAHQPMPSLATSTLSGLFVADSLFSSMSSKLRIARRGELSGIAGTLATSNQLNLV